MKNVFDNLVVSSLDVAQWTGKAHRNVTRDIKRALTRVGPGAVFQEVTYVAGNNQEYPLYIIPKREFLELANGYRDSTKNLLIKKWEILEGEEIALRENRQHNLVDDVSNTKVSWWNRIGNFLASFIFGR